jgi:tRNA(Leu) C34 or U34 (ribose-2'-O)-methylase TrmL
MSTSSSHASIGLVNPKSPTNVGGVMRAAGCYSADAIYYTGKRYDRAAKHQTDTKNIAEKIPLTGVDCLFDAVAEGTKVVCVELVEGATPLPQFEHPANALYILGPEDGNLTQEMVDRADEVVYVPTVGCMNLAATVNVLLYDRLAKSGCDIADDSLIRASRDTNNRVRVKNG